MDYSLYKTINGLSGSEPWDSIVRFIANDLPAILIALVALSFLIPWSRNRDGRRSGAVLATAASGLALLIAQPISHAVDRLRPFAAHPAHAHLLISRSPDPSFPSDHATGAFALAVGLWLYDRTFGTIMLVLAALLSFARVYVGTHYPLDVVAGAALGAGVAFGLYLLPHTRRLLEGVAARVGGWWDLALTRGRSRAGAAAS